MQVEIVNEGTLGKKVSLRWSKDEVAERRGKVLRSLAGKVKLPGFRPGKNPQGLIEKRFGSEATTQTEEELANEGLRQAMQEHKLKPVGPLNHVGSERDNGYSLTFAFEIHPAITVPDVKSFTLPKEDISVTPADIDEFIGGLTRRAGTLSALAEGETIAEDDSVTMTGKVTVGDAVARELHDFHHLVGGYPLLGTPAEKVVEMLASKGVGAVLEFDTTLPDTFAPAEHAGKAAHVAVTIQSANRNRAAALDDAFAKQMGLDDLSKLREAVENSLKSKKDNELHQKQVAALEEQLLEKTTVELPPQLRERMHKERGDAAAQAAEAAKKSPEDIAAARSESLAATDKGMKRYLILAALSEQLKVTVTREDLDSQIRMAAMRSGQTSEAIAKRLQDSGQLQQVAEEVREGKTIEALLEQALA